jgi:hypothetical protein
VTDRSRDTSEALKEIRTVRSRAVAARERLALHDGNIETRRVPAGMVDDEYLPVRDEYYRDADADEMDAALAEFIDKTAKFARRGEHKTAGQRRRGAI